MAQPIREHSHGYSCNDANTVVDSKLEDVYFILPTTVNATRHVEDSILTCSGRVTSAPSFLSAAIEPVSSFEDSGDVLTSTVRLSIATESECSGAPFVRLKYSLPFSRHTYDIFSRHESGRKRFDKDSVCTEHATGNSNTHGIKYCYAAHVKRHSRRQRSKP